MEIKGFLCQMITIFHHIDKWKGETEFNILFDPTDPLTLWSFWLGLFAHLECAIEFWFLWLMNTTQPRPPKILSLFIIWEFVSTFHAQRLQLTQRRLFERWEFMVTGHWIRAAPTYEAMNGQQYSVSSRVLVAQSAREYNCVCINVGQYDCIRICNNGVDNNCFCVCIRA